MVAVVRVRTVIHQPEGQQAQPSGSTVSVWKCPGASHAVDVFNLSMPCILSLCTFPGSATCGCALSNPGQGESEVNIFKNQEKKASFY